MKGQRRKALGAASANTSRQRIPRPGQVIEKPEPEVEQVTDYLLERVARTIDATPLYIDCLAEAREQAAEEGLGLFDWVMRNTCGLGEELGAALAAMSRDLEAGAEIAGVGDFWTWWRNARHQLGGQKIDEAWRS